MELTREVVFAAFARRTGMAEFCLSTMEQTGVAASATSTFVLHDLLQARIPGVQYHPWLDWDPKEGIQTRHTGLRVGIDVEKLDRVGGVILARVVVDGDRVWIGLGGGGEYVECVRNLPGAIKNHIRSRADVDRGDVRGEGCGDRGHGDLGGIAEYVRGGAGQAVAACP